MGIVFCCDILTFHTSSEATFNIYHVGYVPMGACKCEWPMDPSIQIIKPHTTSSGGNQKKTYPATICIQQDYDMFYSVTRALTDR